MATFTVSFITPAGVETITDVTHATLPGIGGVVGVLAHHATMSVGLKSGLVRVMPGDKHYFVSGGLADIHNNSVKILTDTFQALSDLDPRVIQEDLDQHLHILSTLELDHDRFVMQKRIDILRHQLDLASSKNP